MGSRGPRAGRVSHPQPTIHLVPWASHQCATAATSAVMPSHLCRRYILSSPFSSLSAQRGRTASTMAKLIAAIATTPVSWMAALRKAKYSNGRGHRASARNQLPAASSNKAPRAR